MTKAEEIEKEYSYLPECFRMKMLIDSEIDSMYSNSVIYLEYRKKLLKIQQDMRNACQRYMKRSKDGAI